MSVNTMVQGSPSLSRAILAALIPLLRRLIVCSLISAHQLLRARRVSTTKEGTAVRTHPGAHTSVRTNGRNGSKADIRLVKRLEKVLGCLPPPPRTSKLGCH